MVCCAPAAKDRKPGGKRSAFSLIEILVIITLMGIFAGMVVTMLEPNVPQQLSDTVRLVEAELNYARSLAISNGSQYRLAIDAPNNRLIITHIGTNPALNTLPTSPFANAGDGTSRQILDFDLIPKLGSAVTLYGAFTANSSFTGVTNIEFNSYGELVSGTPTVIYLAARTSDSRWYVSATVNAVTGLVSLSDPTTNVPGSEF